MENVCDTTADNLPAMSQIDLEITAEWNPVIPAAGRHRVVQLPHHNTGNFTLNNVT
jgi:hypothetical protein